MPLTKKTCWKKSRRHGRWCSIVGQTGHLLFHLFDAESAGAKLGNSVQEITLTHDSLAAANSLGQPVEVAPPFVMLASDEGSYMSGTMIAVTGGAGSSRAHSISNPQLPQL